MKKILIVGRNPLALKRAARLLDCEGYKVSSAITNEEAYDRFKELEPQLVLLGDKIDDDSRREFKRIFLKKNPNIQLREISLDNLRGQVQSLGA